MAEKPIIIVGGGGHTSALIGVLKANGATIRGIITRDSSIVGSEIHAVPVLGVEDFYKIDPKDVDIVNGVGNKPSRLNAGALEPREGVYKRYKDWGFEVLPVISANITIQPDVHIGHAVQIMPGVIIQAGAMIGDNTVLNTGCIVDHDTVVAPHAHIAPGAVLCGGVSIGEMAHIGAGSTVIQGIKIGSKALIGAGITVRRDVRDSEVVLD